MRLLRSLYFFITVLATIMTCSSAEEPGEIKIDALTDQSEVVVDLAKGTGWGANGVMVRYANAVLTAQSFTNVNINTGEVEALGNVTLQRDADVWRGERLLYNFKTRELQTDAFRTGRAPFFATGESLSADTTNRTYTLHGASLTTDDVEEPGYVLRAKSITIIEGKRIEARQATLYLGNVPVMFFPYYSQSLGDRRNHWTLTPGYRSKYGPFLLTSYSWELNTNFFGAINMDFRLKRGVGVGPDFGWNLGRWGTGEARFYYTHDDDPDLDPAGNPIQDERHRFNFTHLATLRTNLTAKVVVREQSDAYFIRDFFESEYRDNTQPKTLLELNQTWPNWSLNLLGQAQINDFFQTIERLPDVKLSGIRMQLGESPFFYESESSFGYLRFEPDERTGLTEYAAVRADTYHQILLPYTFFGWLNVAPRVGGRFTHYGETEGPGTTFDDRDRAVFNTGAEITFKASRTWPGARSKLWDVDGIRHIIEPSFNYVYVPEPGRTPPELPQFDTAIPMLRLLPVDFPDYNAIDSIDTQNVLRLGLRNKVQTKRGGEIENLLNLGVMIDWRLNPRDQQSTFSDLYTQIDFLPRSWLGLSSEFRYDTHEHHMRYSDTHFTLTPDNRWSWSLGHLFFREEPALGPDSGNNLFRSRFYYQLNENWGFRMTHHFEARDGQMEEQSYTIYRDLRSWTSALSFRIRNEREGPDDFTVALTFSLKAFPRFKLGKDRDQHTLLFGG